jgi:hypothetical protein
MKFVLIPALISLLLSAVSIGPTQADARAAWDPYSAPTDLGGLGQRIGQSVVTLYCGKTAVSAWSADIRISSEAAQAGYKSYLLTTYSAMSPCMYEGKRFVEMRHRGIESLGYVWSWDKSSGLAAVFTNQVVTPLKWNGNPRPVNGQWVAAVGSAFGSGQSLSTGAVNSVELRAFRATIAVPTSSSGAPVVDNLGRVIGMATDRASVGGTYMAGTPLLCVDLIECARPLDVWAVITPPGPPTGVTAVGGVGSATVSWSAPVSNGGSAITSFTAVANPGGARCVSSSTRCVVTGLSAGTSYTFTVFASNAMGDGPASMPSSPVMPKAAIPGVVRNLRAVPGAGSATLTWVPPSNAAEVPVLYYQYRVNSGTWKRANSPRVVVTALAKGKVAVIQVIAVASSGTGSPATVRVTPR